AEAFPIDHDQGGGAGQDLEDRLQRLQPGGQSKGVVGPESRNRDAFVPGVQPAVVADNQGAVGKVAGVKLDALEAELERAAESRRRVLGMRNVVGSTMRDEAGLVERESQVGSVCAELLAGPGGIRQPAEEK